MTTKIEIGIEYMIERAQVNNPSATKTEHAYNACRAVRDAVRAVLPELHGPQRALDALVRRLAPGTLPIQAAGNSIRQPTRQLKPRLPSAKKQRALKHLTNPVYSGKLRCLPALLYAEVPLDQELETELATLLDHACVLEVMMVTGLGPDLVAKLRLGRHVIDEGGRMLIRVPAAETHNGIERESAFFGHSRNILETYLRRVRVLRPGHLTDYLFPGKRGRGRHPNALAQAVRRLISDGTEHPISAKDVPAAVCIMHALGANASDATLQRYLARKQTDNDPIVNWIRVLKTKT